MAGQLELPFWPSNIECLDWSKDNLIAVAGGDSIAILIPRLKEPGPNGTLWDSIIFKANAFTADEIPLSEVLSFRNFSIGEEQSQRHIQSLAWSSPGLGKYGRCVLAVLSSNHVLSIWECDGKIDVFADWKRKVVVNHPLQNHYQGLSREADETDQAFRERLQVAQRVRTFTWSQPVYKEWAPSDPSTLFIDDGHQFLVVSTEAADIALLRVSSPYHILDPVTDSWRVEVTHCISFSFLIPQPETDATAAGTQSNPDHGISDHMSWSCTNPEDTSGMHSKLAFISRCRLYYATVECSPYDKDTKASFVDTEAVHLLPSTSDLTGPLKFVPDTQSLIMFGPDTVYHVDTAKVEQAAGCSTSHHLDGRWDEISGIAFSKGKSPSVQLHLTSLLSSSTMSTTVLSLPFNKNETSIVPAWKTALANIKSDFSTQYKLQGNVLERVWGMAASPMSDLIATATVLLPSDSPAYMTPSDYRTVVNITRQNAQDDVMPVNCGFARPSDLKSAVLLFAAKSYVKQLSGPVDMDKLVRAMSSAFEVPDDEIEYDLNILMEQGMEPLQHARYLRLRLFILPEMRNARFRLLAEMASKRDVGINSISKLVVEHLVAEVLKIPASFSRAGKLSGSIYKAYETLRLKLQPEPEFSASENATEIFEETCRICSETIPFESIKWARCKNGHQFSRCGLTFLAMQEPGISKQCTMCGTQFLNEWTLPTLVRSSEDQDVDMADAPGENEPRGEETADRGNGNTGIVTGGNWVHVVKKAAQAEPDGSLARILFAAFDKCVYCGGNF